MASDRLFAVFDVRERGEYNECQIPGTTSLPRSQIEFRIESLVPNRRIPITVYDDADGRAPLALKTLNRAWLFRSIDSRRRTDRVAQRWTADRQRRQCAKQGVRRKSASRAKYSGCDAGGAESAMQEAAPELLILDVRTPEEYGQILHSRRNERSRRRSHFVGG